jgi:hypothetical protein
MFDLFAAYANDNRRASVRGPLYVLVEARTVAQPMWAFDLSLGGARCVTERPIWPGTYLDLAFTLPDSHERIVTGSQVVTLDTSESQEVMLGLRFCCLADGARMAIYRFLDRRRRLWDPALAGEEGSLASRYPHLAHIFDQPQPFANLLAETYAALGLSAPHRDNAPS